MSTPLIINERVTIPAHELSWAAARAGGPGGQNVNKVASKVELRFDLANSTALELDARARLGVLAANRLDSEGRVLIVSQVTRDQLRNLEDARAKLRALVLRALERPVVRRATKPSRRAKARRAADKRHQSVKKQNRTGSAED